MTITISEEQLDETADQIGLALRKRWQGPETTWEDLDQFDQKDARADGHAALAVLAALAEVPR